MPEALEPRLLLLDALKLSGQEQPELEPQLQLGQGQPEQHTLLGKDSRGSHLRLCQVERLAETPAGDQPAVAVVAAEARAATTVDVAVRMLRLRLTRCLSRSLLRPTTSTMLSTEQSARP